MVEFGELPERERNSMRLCLSHPPPRDFYRDRELVIYRGADGESRTALNAIARSVGDRALAGTG